MKTFIDKMDYAVKNWWLSLLVGLLYIIVAIYLMFAPLASYVALSILFSVSMFVSGLFGRRHFGTHRRNYPRSASRKICA